MINEPFSPSEFSTSRRWNAKWIWLPGIAKEKNIYCYFRREIEIKKKSDMYRMYIAADTRYQLFINGKFVGRGAPQSSPTFQYYDERDVTEFLRLGKNCIAIIVYHLGTVFLSRGGLLAELIDEEDSPVVSTDVNWRVARAAAWEQNTFCFDANKVTPFQESFDTRKVPEGWDSVGFDDSGWQPVVVVKGFGGRTRPPAVSPWSLLVPRDIPFMTHDPLLPVKVERIEENLDLANRMRGEDLSIALSMPGTPLKYAVVENADNLCGEKDDTIVQCSTHHLDPQSEHYYDGIKAPSIVLDLGRVVTAYIELKFTGVAGGMIDIGYAERLIDGQFVNALEGMFADRVVMKEGEQTYQPFTWKGFRYVKLRFHNCFKPVEVHSVRAMVTTYPFEERGGFECGDETMNRIFDISRSTIRLCSNEFIMDTPWREQAQWLGDVAAVTIPAIYACFGDTRLPGKFYRQAAQHQYRTGMLSNVSNDLWLLNRCIPDYSLWWVIGLWQHYLYTGEERWINEFYPVVCRVIQAHFNYTNERGLIENMPFLPLIEWARLEREGESAVNSALFYGALEVVGKMAVVKNDEYMSKRVREARALMKDNFQKRFYDQQRGCLADACIDDEISPMNSEHANFAAILWDLVDKDVVQEIIKTFYEDKRVEFTEAQPFYMVVVLNALDKVGRFDLALELVRERWGKRMVDKGATSCFEEWSDVGSWRAGTFRGFIRTHSHAWSACPAEFLIRNLMGLEIVEPGCQKIRLNPRKIEFDYSVQYPTPRGDIRVESRKDKVEFSVPDGIQVVTD